MLKSIYTACNPIFGTNRQNHKFNQNTKYFSGYFMKIYQFSDMLGAIYNCQHLNEFTKPGVDSHIDLTLVGLNNAEVDIKRPSPCYTV